MQVEKLLFNLKKINQNFKYEKVTNTIVGNGLELNFIPEILKDVPFNIDLSDNKIKDLNGFKQNGSLVLWGNEINSLNNFKYNEKYLFFITSSIKFNHHKIDKSLLDFLDKNLIDYEFVQKKYKNI